MTFPNGGFDITMRVLRAERAACRLAELQAKDARLTAQTLAAIDRSHSLLHLPVSRLPKLLELGA